MTKIVINNCRAKFTLMTRQEAAEQLNCSLTLVDSLRSSGVLYSVNSDECKEELGISRPHDDKFWRRVQYGSGAHYGVRVGIKQLDVIDYFNKVRSKQLIYQGTSGEEEDKRLSKLTGIPLEEVKSLKNGDVKYQLPKGPKKKYPGVGVPVKGVAPFVPSLGKEEQNKPVLIKLQQEEHQQIEDMINMRLMQLETDLEFKIANEVLRLVKDTFNDALNSARKTIVHDICKDQRNQISGLAEKSMTNFEAINHNMKKMWDTTKGFHEELDAKLSRTYVSFAEVQEKTWKHIKKAVKARTLKPKPSRVSLWRKFMTWASSPTNSTGNNTTEKVGKGKD